MTIQKIDVRAAAIAAGVTWALGILLLGLAARLVGWGIPLVQMTSTLYLGYAPTFTGTAIGTLWALVDGAICGAVFALIYNCAVKCFPRRDEDKA